MSCGCNTLHPKLIVAQARVPRKPSTASSSVAFAATSKMPTPSLGGRERIGLSHKVRDGHRESVFVPRDPGTSISTSGSDVGYLGRAGSFYTAWCQMYGHFTPMTSEVTSAWDAGFQFFHPPPPPPPPPRHRRSSTLWDISAAVPKERTENGCEVHWSNPYGPDPPAKLAPPAAKPMTEDSFQKADKLSTFSSSFRRNDWRMLPRRRPRRRTLAALLLQWRSRLSQPWQICECLQKCLLARLRLSLYQTSTACKVPCRRAPLHQPNPMAAEWHLIRKNLLSTTTADKDCCLLQLQSTRSTDRHRLHLHKSGLHGPSTTPNTA